MTNFDLWTLATRNFEECWQLKIMIVRHGKVNMKWPKMCSSEDFDKACVEYEKH